MTSLLYFSSVPGMAVPGMAQPGRDGQTTLGKYLYAGQMTCYYLDYLDLATGHTLAPVPGNYYTMQVANPRKGLTVPPPGRPWIPGNPGSGGTFAPLLILRRFVVPLAVAHGHYPGAACAHCDPASRGRLLPPHSSAGPGPGPHRTLAESRAALEQQRNAARRQEREAVSQPAVLVPAGPPPPLPAPTVMQQARASLEESRVAHGHYAPGGCKACLSGG